VPVPVPVPVDGAELRLDLLLLPQDGIHMTIARAISTETSIPLLLFMWLFSNKL
jgi:hypothetical protein